MNVIDAAAATVSEYAGGAASLAPRLGKAASTLCHEVDDNYPSAKFGLKDAVRAVQLTGDPRILIAFASECGYSVCKLPEPDQKPEELVALCARLMLCGGESVSGIGSAIADGEITDNERRDLLGKLGQLACVIPMLSAAIVHANEKLHAKRSALPVIGA